MYRPKPVELEIPGLTIRGLEWGDGDRLVVAFHGWLDNAASFSEMAPVLASRGCRVVAVDLPGHGMSDHRSADAHYHYINYAIDAVYIVEALGADRVELLGHSMGAGVSLLSAPALEERVSALHLVEGLGPMTTPAVDAAETFVVASAAHRRVRTRSRGVYPTLEEAVARKAAAINLPPELARPLTERSVVGVPDGFQFGDDPRLSGRSFIRLTEEQVWSFLGRVRCPVVLVRASDGLAYPEEAAAARLSALPNVSVRELQGGHHLHITDPVAVVDALGAFSLS